MLQRDCRYPNVVNVNAKGTQVSLGCDPRICRRMRVPNSFHDVRVATCGSHADFANEIQRVFLDESAALVTPLLIGCRGCSESPLDLRQRYWTHPHDVLWRTISEMLHQGRMLPLPRVDVVSI